MEGSRDDEGECEEWEIFLCCLRREETSEKG
jgi:hypothetical protein